MVKPKVLSISMHQHCHCTCVSRTGKIFPLSQMETDVLMSKHLPPFPKKTIYWKDNLLHQIGEMALSISCRAIYLTNIDEFIMGTIPAAIMKCHPKIGPWLKWRAEISPPIMVKFRSSGDPSFFSGLISLSTLLCLPVLKGSLTIQMSLELPSSANPAL